MRILSIETSCDDTAIALIEASGGIRSPKFKILENIISSQIDIHRPWGGVVPNLAKREHIENLPKIFKKIKMGKKKIDVVAVTVGPGLEPALWAGISFVKEMRAELKKKNPQLKTIGVNHLEGHLYSFLLAQKTEFPNSNPPAACLPARQGRTGFQFLRQKLFPAIALIVSGGHTILLKMDSLVQWKKLGETRDDAVGESFDKVAKMMGFPYPGGPEIQKLAEKGDPKNISFPRPMIGTKDYDFSYSGLKTSVLYYLRDHRRAKKTDVAASFQEAALDVLVKKTARAAREFRAKSVLLSGGVAANKELRHKLSVMCKGENIIFIAPPQNFNTDNAVMIGVAAYMGVLRKKSYTLTANGNMSI